MDDVIDSDLGANEFSLRTAYYLAHASHSAYDEDDTWAEMLGLSDETTQFTCGQFHGFVGFLNGAAVVAFRGTENLENFLTDALTQLVTRPEYPGRVHAGFADAVEAVWPAVCRVLGRPSRRMSVWVTGHSLGGAMATLASVRLAAAGYRVRGVYTYGSPRPGDLVFQKAYQLPNFRFVHDNDIVPHLPVRWCYKHVGELRLFDEHGHILSDNSEWQRRKQALGTEAKHLHRAHRRSHKEHPDEPEFDWLSDHYLANYLTALYKVLHHVPRRRRIDGAESVRPTVTIRRRFPSPRENG